MQEADRARLRKLLGELAAGDAGLEERREADALLEQAVRVGELRSGLAATEVRALLGGPHFTRGAEADGDFGWGYPALPRPEEALPGAEWYMWLEFRGGRVATVGRRAWLAG